MSKIIVEFEFSRLKYVCNCTVLSSNLNFRAKNLRFIEIVLEISNNVIFTRSIHYISHVTFTYVMNKETFALEKKANVNSGN